jgi:hypothetical protein
MDRNALWTKGDLMKSSFRNAVIGMAAAFALAFPSIAVAEATPFENGAFRIVLPDGFGKFAEQAQKVEGENGTIETTNYISKAPTGEAVVVTVSKMPGKILDPDAMISGTRDSLLKSLKATLENEEKRGGEVETTELLFKSDSASPAYLRSSLAVEDDHFYQVLYVGRSEEQRAGPAVRDLFASFQIIAPAAGSTEQARATSTD